MGFGRASSTMNSLLPYIFLRDQISAHAQWTGWKPILPSLPVFQRAGVDVKKAVCWISRLLSKIVRRNHLASTSTREPPLQLGDSFFSAFTSSHHSFIIKLCLWALSDLESSGRTCSVQVVHQESRSVVPVRRVPEKELAVASAIRSRCSRWLNNRLVHGS